MRVFFNYELLCKNLHRHEMKETYENGGFGNTR